MSKKRVPALTLAAVLAAALLLPAQAVGEVVGHIYHTDIAAQIDGHPIRSYNIGGTTVVVAEDLRQYGFDVIWSAGERTLTVERAPSKAADGDYQASDQRRPAGTVAGNILATDIQTYVQGELVESFNIGGETAIRMSDLAVCGDLTWSPEEDLAALTLWVDPMQKVLEEKIAALEHCALVNGTDCSYEVYPNAYGTLLYSVMSGIQNDHSLEQVYFSGRSVLLDDLLPECSVNYLKPRDIQLNEYQNQVSFYTEIWAAENDEFVGWGDTYCVIDLRDPTVVRLDRLDQPLEWWGGSAISDHEHQDDEIEVLFTRTGAEVTGEIKQMFCGWTECSAGSTGVSISFYGNNCGGPCEYCNAGKSSGTDTSWVFYAPSVAEPDFVQTNSPELREKLAQHFQVTLNSQRVTGDLWRSQGNGHVDYNFTFDQPIALSDGDVVRVWMK